jgi:mannose-1-phosphate guanylyltransferase/mannose-6-phosphate isomerase
MNRIVEPGNSLDPSSSASLPQAVVRVSVQPALLAGSAGTRRWPSACERGSRQPTGLTSEESLLEATLDRLDDAFVVAAHNMSPTHPLATAAPLVVCCEALRSQAFERHVPRLVVQPNSRNSAPALTVAALAARAAAAGGDDPIIVALPAEHLIADHAAFGIALAEAFTHAAHGAIVAFGVPPARAATAYGYLRTGTALGTRGARAIVRFVDKPDAELAERYVACGQYWWNSGIFVVRASVWLSTIALCRPVIAAACADAFRDAPQDSDGALRLARDAFASCPSDSIDDALMERIATDARVAGVTVPLLAGWSDASERNAGWGPFIRHGALNLADLGVAFEGAGVTAPASS